LTHRLKPLACKKVWLSIKSEGTARHEYFLAFSLLKTVTGGCRIIARGGLFNSRINIIDKWEQGMYVELKIGNKKDRQKRLSWKKRTLLATLIAISWVSITTLAIASSSISMVEMNCSGMVKVASGCQFSEKVAVFDLADRAFLYVVPLFLLSLYIVYRLIFKKLSSIKWFSAIAVLLVTFSVVVLGVSASFMSAEANNHRILSRSERECASDLLEDYIETGVNKCGEGVDALYNTPLNDLNNSDNSPWQGLLGLWVFYTVAVLLYFRGAIQHEHEVSKHDVA